MLWDTKPQYHTALVMRIDTYLHHGPVTDYTVAMRHKATVSHCTGHENRHLPASHPSNRLYRCSGTQGYSITLVMRIDTYQRHVLNISCSSHVLWLPTMLMSLMKPQDQTGHQTHLLASCSSHGLWILLVLMPLMKLQDQTGHHGHLPASCQSRWQWVWTAVHTGSRRMTLWLKQWNLWPKNEVSWLWWISPFWGWCGGWAVGGGVFFLCVLKADIK